MSSRNNPNGEHQATYTSEQFRNDILWLVGVGGFVFVILQYQRDGEDRGRAAVRQVADDTLAEARHVESQANVKEIPRVLRESFGQLNGTVEQHGPSPDVQVELLKLEVELDRSTNGETVMTKNPKIKNAQAFKAINRGNETAKDVRYGWRTIEGKDWSGGLHRFPPVEQAFRSILKHELGPNESIEFTRLPNIFDGQDPQYFRDISGYFTLRFKNRRGREYVKEYRTEMTVNNTDGKTHLAVRFFEQ